MTGRAEQIKGQEKMPILRYGLPLLLVALFAAPVRAQVDGIRLGLMYQPEYQPGLVVLPFAGDAGAARLAQPVNAIIRQDLDFSDRFKVLHEGIE